MCYMKDPRGEVGVRELRQNLSVYLKRVKRGETLEVNERGHRVAVLAPARSTLLERLVAAGRARAADGDVLALGPPLGDRKSTRLNSSHSQISYAVFCL